MLQFNVPQQVFTLFYAINWGTAANSQPRWKAFAWGAIGQDRASWRRAWLSMFLLNCLPLAYFVIFLWILDRPTWRDLNAWSSPTSWKVFVSILPAFAPFGFYRIWTGVVQRRNKFFYDSPLSKEIGLELSPDSDLNPRWGLSNILWGVVYVLVGPVVVFHDALRKSLQQFSCQTLDFDT